MKNLAKTAGLLFVALGALCVTSCTKQDDFSPANAAKAETTTVAFNVQADSDGSATGKMIDKNAVPAYVNEVTIWANSPLYPASTVLQSFTFGTSTAANPLDAGFSLPGVSLGTNTFGAHSYGNTSDERASLGNVILPSSSSNVLDVMKAHTPWISTAATNVTAIIKKTGNDPVALTMKTDNGRILAKFVQSAPDADNYIATATATIADMNDNGEYITKTLPETTITSTTGFEWSNRFATEGQTATVVIKVYDNLGGGVKGQLLNTVTKTVTVKKATTKLCTFTLKNTDVETDIASGGIVLTFPTIGEEIIND